LKERQELEFAENGIRNERVRVEFARNGFCKECVWL